MRETCVPGAAQHGVVRCRAGTAKVCVVAVPDQQCTAPRTGRYPTTGAERAALHPGHEHEAPNDGRL
jgi:hypothetical protein